MRNVSSKTTVLLWDIDGTLTGSGGAGSRALTIALQQTFGIEGSLDDIDFAGRTDRWILRQIFLKFSISATEWNFSRYLESYLAVLPAALVNPGAKVLPGVESVLAAAGSAGFAQGLLTGNVRRGAQAKLTHHGLWGHFSFGAYGDDGEVRNELGPHALRRAREHTGAEIVGEQVWIIGDTAHDIACARAIGARVLAVATGGHTWEELAQHQPDALVPDLADTAEVLRVLAR
jgi:phosphoglycolate phosphatase